MSYSSQFVKAVHSSNLCTFYVLPFTGLSKFSFGTVNFLNSYVTTSGSHILVKVTDKRDCYPEVFTNPYFEGLLLDNTGEYIMLKLDPIWLSDFEKFKAGKYSQFSPKAKVAIISFSGLGYKEPGINETTTDARLLVLDKSPTLREKWIQELDLPTWLLDEEDELISKPSPEVYKNLPNQ